MLNSEHRRIVAESNALIYKYETLIAQYTSLSKKAHEERQIAQLELDAIVYPVLTLPVEITSEIFLHCLSSTPTNPWDTMHTPIRLTHVCRIWREIAISTPALWANIEMEILDDLKDREFLEAWVTRSGEVLQSIKLTGPSLSDSEDEDEEEIVAPGRTLPTIFAPLASSSHRIGTLDLSYLGVENLLGLDDIAPGPWNFLALQKLSIVFSHVDQNLALSWERPESSVFPIITFSDAPLLREVHFSRVSPMLFSIPWHQLTRFTGYLLHVKESLVVLQLCPNLTECILATFTTSQRFDTTIHLRLKSLTLHIVSGARSSAWSSRILNFLSLPSLQSLAIRTLDDITESAFKTFISHSPSLRKLHFHPNDPVKWRASVFVSMPGLAELDIGSPSWSFIVEFFGPLIANVDFLPHLQHLTMSPDRTFSDAQIHRLLEVIGLGLRARWHTRQDARLTQMTTCRLVLGQQCATPSEAVLLPLKELKAEGLDISIETAGYGNSKRLFL
ncbi:hypothetical protein B0H16DRAFT_1686491 [Mycena metata]|uniref:F-box domain-containing protein n=1 Tax=Mycena metata TaxID=1033252 RepID=A0AAD7JNG5_9AGAR|nr:hypothetical protein B0H16DRAFT_1686491 [Mycena metata]